MVCHGLVTGMASYSSLLLGLSFVARLYAVVHPPAWLGAATQGLTEHMRSYKQVSYS